VHLLVKEMCDPILLLIKLKYVNKFNGVCNELLRRMSVRWSRSFMYDMAASRFLVLHEVVDEL
jgi:hypothetical protein